MKRGIITIMENGTVAVPTVPVWMSQQEMADMFEVFGHYIRKAVREIYKDGVLTELETMRNIVMDENTDMDVYSLEMIIAVSFRIGGEKARQLRTYISHRMMKRESTPPVCLFINDIFHDKCGN